MSHKIAAVEGSLLRGAEAVAGAHADVADSTARVRAQLEALRLQWQGGAAKAYDRMLDTWAADAARLNAILVELETAMRQAEADRAALEAENTGLIGALGSVLGGLGDVMRGK